jgi:hypothetical protein
MLKSFENFHQKKTEGVEKPDDPETKKESPALTKESPEELASDRVSKMRLSFEGLERGKEVNNTLGLSQGRFEVLKANFGLNEKLNSISQRGRQLFDTASKKVIEISKTEEANLIMDATPFVGGSKKIAESLVGKTLSGKEMGKWERVKHGTKGAIDLGLSLTGVGEIRKAEKGARLAALGKRMASGIASNPEAVKGLGKKILKRNEY